jgi:hypothetical protein
MQGNRARPLRLRVRRDLRKGVRDCADLEEFNIFNGPRGAWHLRQCYAALDVCKLNRGCMFHQWNVRENST